MKNPTRLNIRRLKFAIIIVSLVVFFLFYKLAKIQLVEANDLKKQAMRQWTKSLEIEPLRGIIYDRNGKKLAINAPSYTVWAYIAEIENPQEVAEQLSPHLEISEEEILKLITTGTNMRKLKQSISLEQAEAIKSLGINGITITEGTKRYYPLNNLASYVLGFTDIDNNGQYGVEKSYNSYLKGTPGLWIKSTDAVNRQLPFDGEIIYDAQNGNNLILTIDENIQRFAEEAAYEALVNNDAKSVNVIVMDPMTGEILAMANKPDYNINSPRTPIDEQTKMDWANLDSEQLQNEWFKLWRNYSVNDLYEPGSTFKIITAAAAIEEGLVNQNTHFHCNGFYREIPNVTLRCAKWYDPHGDQDLYEAFANSCNIAFINMANMVGKETMLKYIKAFGFGELTEIDLIGEQRGIIPMQPKDISDVNLATISYGHSVAVTPIQMINALSAVANGGYLMTPHVVKTIIDEDGNIVKNNLPEIKRQVISQSTSKIMLEMLEKTVSEGTGTKSYIPGYRVGGKTGTAEKIIDGKYVQDKYISSFGGVAPVENPRIAVLFIVDEPSVTYYGGTVAGPYAKDIIEKTLEYLGVPKEMSEEEIEENTEELIMPDLVGLTLLEASKLLNELNIKYVLEYKNISQESIVSQQFPLAGQEIDTNTIVDLYFEESKP
ncbi:MAG: PASTA domain-containing protein [Tissierellales bacterium]|nr:PASTA domain-containing protein [Tissierellales bacterium]